MKQKKQKPLRFLTGRARRPRAALALVVMAMLVIVGGYVVVHLSRAAALTGDINGDGVVNVFDLSILLSDWNTNTAPADINKDGTVNVFDLSILLSHWGQTGPTPTPTPSPSPSPTGNTCPSPTPTAPVAGYTISACEDFNNGLGAFAPYNGGGSGTVVGAGRTPSQCTVSSGILQLKQASNGATCGGWMNGFYQQYGYFEVRMKAAYTSSSGGSAPHPVLILWPGDGQWTSELDFFETNLGSPAGGFLHCTNNASQNCYVLPSNNVDYSQWHVYGFEWKSGSMTGYIDGTKWWTSSNTSSFQPLGADNLTIQLDNLSGSTPVRPGEMDIDWAHMYK